MQFITDYIRNSYTVLMLLAGLAVMFIANRRKKIEGTQYFLAIIGILFAITVFEYLEKWCDTYQKPVWILYFKAAVSYSLYPLLMILELFLIARIKHKILIMIPYFIELPFLAADLFGTHFVYGYHADHGFDAGKLHILPALVLYFYLMILLVYSMRLIVQKDNSRAMIAVFVSCSAMLTTFLEYSGMVTGRTTEIAALEILIYYFYLSANYYGEVQEKLHKKEVELATAKADFAESRLTMMLAQIKPHYIYNSMNSIMELCYSDPELAAETVAHFSDYLRGKIEAFDSKELSWFDDELALIKEYLSIEYADRNKVFRVEYDLACTDFRLPALTVQPLVENAVKHGIDRYSEDSLVQIMTCEDAQNICIRVTDNGTAEQGDDSLFATERGIGLSNAAERLKMLCSGDISVTHDGSGTTAEITIPKKEGT